MAASLKGFEMSSASGSPLSGLVVQLYAASDVQPNVGTLLASTTTDLNGMWQFTGLTAGLYDVKITAPGISQVKWYKGNVKVGIAELYAVMDEPSRAGKNRVINGRFTVSERLFVAQTDNAWWIDNWRTLLEAASAAAWSRDTADVPAGAKYAAKGVVGSGNNNKFGTFQTLEDREITDLIAKNGSYSVQLKATAGLSNVKAGLLGWTGTANATTGDPVSSWGADGVTPTMAAGWVFINTPVNLNVTTSWAKYIVAENLAVLSSYNNVGVFIWNDDKTTTQTTDILRVADVQVEAGPFATEIDQRPWPVEASLALAHHADVGAVSAAIYLAHDVNGASRTLAIRISPPVPMRASPSVTVRGTWTIANVNSQPAVLAGDRFGASLNVISTAAGYSSMQTADATTYVSFDAGV